MSDVVLLTCYDGQGRLLVGRRNDNERYTLPGGHVEPGESPDVAALREMYEETGLHAQTLSYLTEYTTHEGVRLHCYSAFVTGKPHGNNDPDREVSEWEFVDVREGLPPKVFNHLHGPVPETGDNLVTKLFRLHKAEDLEKREGQVFHSDEWGTSKISIPAMTHPDRPKYDAAYEQAIKAHYGRGLKKIKVNTADITPVNEVANKSRFNLYRRMARRDRLPPLVVQRSGSGYKALDGNHKYHAAVAEKVPQLDAYEVPFRKAEVDPTDPRLMKMPLGRSCPHGLEMFLVNGEFLRNHVDSDFVQGGNPERYSWIPEGEIWIDETTPTEELPYVALHECDEANLMHSHHEGYEKAHDQAQRVEDKYRHENLPGEMAKGEDEVERMLEHPNHHERTLALKLNTVTPKHLQIAAMDPDPAVHQAAIDHPSFGAAQGLHLVESTSGQDGQYPLAQQMAFLGRHDKVEPYHLSSLLRTADGVDQVTRKNIHAAVATHPKATDTILRSMYFGPTTDHDTRLAVLGHANVPPDVLDSAVTAGRMIPGDGPLALGLAAAAHKELLPDTLDELAHAGAERGGADEKIGSRALETHVARPELYQHLFQQARMKPDSGAARMLGALMRGPSSTQERADEIATHVHPSGHADALQGQHVRPQHLDRAVAWAHSHQDNEMMSKLMDNPAFGARHFQAMLQKMEPLEKAVKPEHFKAVVRALDDNAHNVVDHKPDLSGHPPEHGANVEAYHNHVLNHEKKLKPVSGGPASLEAGVTRKRVFHAHVAGENEPAKFMVKPDHERVIRRAKTWVQHPIQGWAEMTNQALYHAAGIGHLHQKVHVSEHDMGPGHEHEPALVVKLEPGMKDQYEVGNSMPPTDEQKLDVRKIAVMDMLSNNLDRHGGNLMRGPDGSVLAVDHSRSFQYVANNKYNPKDYPDDHFRHYHADALAGVHPMMPESGDYYNRNMIGMESYKPVFDWWEQVGPKVRAEFHKRLDQIKDPEVRAHLKRNFDSRADWMDERAKFGIENYGVTDWHRDPIQTYKFGELTDQEKEERDARARRQSPE